METKWLALAVAVAIVVPLAATAKDPGMTILDLAAEIYGKAAAGHLGNSTSNITGQRGNVTLVEGHNTYVIIEIHRQNKASANLSGFIDCQYTANVDPSEGNPIDVIRSLYASASVHCKLGDRVIVYPASGSSTTSSASPPTLSSLVPTGETTMATGPDGSAYAVDVMKYDAVVTHPDGTFDVETFPAWVTPLTYPHADPVTGKTWNFVAPDSLPDDLARLGMTRATATLESRLDPG